MRSEEAAVDECSFDAVDTFPDHLLRQSDDHGFGQGRNSSLD